MLMRNWYEWVDTDIIDTQKPLKELWWVAIVIKVKESIDDTKSKVLMIVENQLKPWKKIGQLSVPFWTIEDWEDKFETLERELWEELWLIINHLHFTQKGKFDMVVEYWDINIKVNLFVFYLTLIWKPKIKNENPDEIKKIVLQDCDELEKLDESEIRPWTKESLDIVDNRNNWKIIYVKDGEYIK